LYFDPSQPLQLAQRLRELFTDEALRIGMRDRGFRRAQHHSWRKGAARNLSAIGELLAQ
jgi:hypothetical protein